MLYHAKNGTVVVDGKTMDYISFGAGGKNLIMIPGVGEGLKTVKGTALPFALMYRAFAQQYSVYVFSRPRQLAAGHTTRDMARDLKLAMDAVGLASASVVGVSLGGMIAQYLALDHPDRVEKLVLAVTLSQPNHYIEEATAAWIAMAQRGEYKNIMIDSAERSYSEAYLRSHRWFFPLLGLTGKPRDFSRFIVQAEACRSHNAYERLPELSQPTLIMSGCVDKIVGADAGREIAEQISGSQLFIYQGLGHAAYEEAKDFNQRILNFLVDGPGCG